METQLRLARHTRRMHNMLGKGCDSARRQRRHMQMHFWHEPSGGQNVLITCRQAEASRKRDRQAGSQTDRQTERREERVTEADDTFGCRCGNYNLPSCMRLIKACNASQAKRGPGPLPGQAHSASSHLHHTEIETGKGSGREDGRGHRRDACSLCCLLAGCTIACN